MKPILYESTETQFTSNGLGRLADCIDCTVTEERNGIYECRFSYPVTGAMYSQIQIGRILGVIHDDVKDVQPFDIYAKSAPLDGVVTFYAHHISYRLGHVILKPMDASSCAAAFAAIPVNTYNNCPFTFWTDKAVEATWQNKTPSAVKAILGGQQGSILDVYGKGEYMWDKWLVRLYTNRGSDNNVSIRYGVNLTELQQELDDSGSYNAVAPYWVSREDGTVVTLTDGIVVYGGVQPSEPVVPVPMDLSDAFDVQPTETQLQTEALRRLTDSEAWLPSENITVSFVDLAGTKDYKSVSALQRVSLCDRVSVYCGPLGVSAVKMQVIRVVYNVLTERYDEIELGKAKATLAETITERVEEITRDLPTNSMMQQAIQSATEQITGAAGGHLLDIYDANGKRQEMVIMDTEDAHTAVKVWRWNMGGLGYSKNGYSGPYGLAITQDGAIVADFITVGTLIANIIKAGILSDESGKNFWNMETGEFSLAAATTVGGSTVDSIAQNKANSAVTAFDNSLNQQSVFNRLTNNGQTQGIYLNNGLLYINASYIGGGIIDGTVVQVKLLNIINNNNKVIASFDDSIRIGESDKVHINIDYNSFDVYKNATNTIFSVGDLRDSNGRSRQVEHYTGDGSRRYFVIHSYRATIVSIKVNGSEVTEYTIAYASSTTGLTLESAPANGADVRVEYTVSSSVFHYDFGIRNGEDFVGNYSVIEGDNTIASGQYSHAEGSNTVAGGYYSHAEGEETKIEFTGNGILGGAHAEGYQTSIQSDDNSFAQGAHVEGYQCSVISRGGGNHAEGYKTKVNGYYGCHAEGEGTIARGYSQHVAGRYNVEDTGGSYYGIYAEIIGNGTNDSNRSNARTLTKTGNEWIAGTLTQASDSRLKEESGEVPDLSDIRARRFKWNDKKGAHDDLDHIGYFAQDVEKVAPYLVQEDAMGYKSLDYIALLCAKVEYLERRVQQLENEVKRHDD